MMKAHATFSAGMVFVCLLVIGYCAGWTVVLGIGVTPVFLLFYAVIDLVFLAGWTWRLCCITSLACGRGLRWLIGLTLPLCLGIMLVVLQTLADPEVQADAGYQAGFLIAWGAMLVWVHVVGCLMGLEWLAQGLERRNRGAVWAGVGLSVGATLAVAGANIGEGPTMATTIGPMFLAVGGLLGLWLLFAAVTGNTIAVTVERDQASGLRLGGLLIAWGLILGRSVAGDWESLEATWQDFYAEGLIPGLVLLGIAVGVEILLRPTKRRPFPPLLRCGVVPAGTFALLAVVWLWHLGVPT